jgi:phosphoribosylformimino-5-aminoimidazole carboxamide ribotide isomerase
LHLIPVVDLMQGKVVHAREGRRSEYRPVQSVLSSSAEPQAVVEGLLRLFPFRTVYIADLDAIDGRGSHHAVIDQLNRAFPSLEFWIDCGLRDIAGLEQWLLKGSGRPVLGSESIANAELLVEAQNCCRHILSLDFDADGFRGPPALLSSPERYWPECVLAMNLLRIGSVLGPDLRLILELAARRVGCDVYAAGGVRSAEDLQRVAEAGAKGALLASALHDGRLGTADLARFVQ